MVSFLRLGCVLTGLCASIGVRTCSAERGSKSASLTILTLLHLATSILSLYGLISCTANLFDLKLPLELSLAPKFNTTLASFRIYN